MLHTKQVMKATAAARRPPRLRISCGGMTSVLSWKLLQQPKLMLLKQPVLSKQSNVLLQKFACPLQVLRQNGGSSYCGFKVKMSTPVTTLLVEGKLFANDVQLAMQKTTGREML